VTCTHKPGPRVFSPYPQPPQAPETARNINTKYTNTTRPTQAYQLTLLPQRRLRYFLGAAKTCSTLWSVGEIIHREFIPLTMTSITRDSSAGKEVQHLIMTYYHNYAGPLLTWLYNAFPFPASLFVSTLALNNTVVGYHFV